MEEIIRVREESGNRLVDARELHEFLESRSKFADWIKNRIIKYGFIEGQDFMPFSKILETGGRQIEYGLTLDMANELSMVENNDKGRLARKYFIEIERKFKEIVPLSTLDILELTIREMRDHKRELSDIRKEVREIRASVVTTLGKESRLHVNTEKLILCK